MRWADSIGDTTGKCKNLIARWNFRNGQRPIDFKTVAQAGNVSLAYLYRNDDLKNLIERLQAKQFLNRSDSDQVIIDEGKDERLEVARLLDENASLRGTNKRLQEQNKKQRKHGRV